MRSLIWIALAAMLCALAAASHRSIHLDSSGFYRGLVVGFSSDFRSDNARYQVDTVQRLMARLQNFSNILHRLLGVRIGEVTIVLPDSWSIADQLANVTVETFQDVARRTVSEADIVFTDSGNDGQILTMQWGECGEPGRPIYFSKTYMIDEDRADRLLAHQWLLYRYGVFNEFGYVNDHTYPVYFRPIDGGALEPTSSKSLPNSCSDKNDYKLLPGCENMEVNPETGRPLNPMCDLIPNSTIHSSFLYAPLLVSRDDYHICNASTHDYTSPNKQNAICGNKSPLEVIRSHSDFENFPLGGKPHLPPASPIKFKIWSRDSPANKAAESQLAHVFYALPQGFRVATSFLGMVQKFSMYGVFKHMGKVAFYKGELLDKMTDNWVPSQNLPVVPSSPEQTNSVNLSSVFNGLLTEFKAPTSRSGGLIVFILSGNYTVTTMEDPNSVIEKLADRLNQANIGLKVVVIDRIPDKIVVRFFDQLVNKLTTMKSSVHYAVTPMSADNGAKSRVYSELMTFLYDSLQMATEQTHIFLKRDTFSTDTSKEFQLKFSIDSGFKDIAMANKWLLIELYSMQGNQINLGKSRLHNAIDQTQVIQAYNTDGRDNDGFLIFKGTDLKAGHDYVFNGQTNQIKPNSVTVSVRMLSTADVTRSYSSDPPVTGSCWVQSSMKNYPLRGYVQLGQGWNGPVYDSEVTMIVRRFTTGTESVQEFQIPLVDNGLASPDLTENDGIYSSYLDNVLADLPDNDVVFQISARVSAPRASFKPGNFGNTVLLGTQKRCCGYTLGSSDDIVFNSPLDRVIDCGSFHLSLNDQSSINRQNYAIRDLRVYKIDAEKRTVTIEWNSPFVPSTNSDKHTADVKFFYSKDAKSKLPRIIKDKFATEPTADIELLDKTEKTMEKRSAELAPTHFDNVPENHLDANGFIQDEEDGYSYADNSAIHDPRQLQHEIQQANVPSEGLANSIRKVTINVKKPEAGYYFIAVQERDGSKLTRPSNVIAVYLKSNLQLDNKSAFAIEQGNSTEDPHMVDNAGLGWHMILLLSIGCALLLFILILVAICFTIRRRRQSTKETDVKAFESSNLKNTMHESNKSLDASRRGQQYYMGLQNGQQPDRSSLQSENGLSGHGSQGPASQHTSCTEVNQVHDGANLQYYHNQQYPASEHSPTISAKGQMKELNVATLLPNSWDAKDLLDHWGRVQEAKQRHEMPGMLQTTAIPAHSTSDEDTPSPYSQHPSQTPVYYSAHPQYMYETDEYYHQQQTPHMSHPQSAHYSPYSNASSIWQHHQQQQQNQSQQQQSHQQHQRMGYHHQASYPYDEPGLPEYSVVRKVPVVSPQPNPPNHANISQV